MHLSPLALGSLCLVLTGMIFPVIAIDRDRNRARWAKWFFSIAGVLCVALGVFKLTLSFHWIHLVSEASVRQEKVIVTGTAGLVIGLIFALIISGELFGKKSPTRVEDK